MHGTLVSYMYRTLGSREWKSDRGPRLGRTSTLSYGCPNSKTKFLVMRDWSKPNSILEPAHKKQMKRNPKIITEMDRHLHIIDVSNR